MELENKKVVLIGGSHGMGLGTAKIASAAGAEVILVGRGNDQLLSVKETLGPKTRAVAGDLTLPDMFPDWLEEIGKFDHLFISASPGGESSFKSAYPTIESSYLYGKFWYTFIFLQKAINYINPGGSITLMSGGFAVRPHPDYALVTVAFAATEALAKAMAVSLAPIRVNAIRPTFIDKEGDHTATNKNITCFMGTNHNVGQAVIFLMTNPYMTGQVLDVDGGAAIAGFTSAYT
jgi:NAD(P)-dependent dehydrogenase (short-subunit alcohol dehydrogenase family)